MRQYQTYLLRLLIDPDAAEAELHGSLKAIGEEQATPFQSTQALLNLLQQLVTTPADAPPDPAHFDKEPLQ